MNTRMHSAVDHERREAAIRRLYELCCEVKEKIVGYFRGPGIDTEDFDPAGVSYVIALTYAGAWWQAFNPDWASRWKRIATMIDEHGPSPEMQAFVDMALCRMAEDFGITLPTARDYFGKYWVECDHLDSPLPATNPVAVERFPGPPVAKYELPKETMYIVPRIFAPAFECAIDRILAPSFHRKRKLQSRPRMSFLDHDVALSTLAIHYLRRAGGGRLGTDAAIETFCSWTGIDIRDRTFRHRLRFLRNSGLI